jgi:hypothetical protein
VGRFRLDEHDHPINSASEYITDDGETVHLAGPRDVAEFAAGSEDAQNAFIEHLFNQMVKQPMLAYGPEVMDRLRQSFVASQFNMRTLMVDIATVSALHGVGKAAETRRDKAELENVPVLTEVEFYERYKSR